MAYESPLEPSVLGNTIRVSHPVIPPNLLTYQTVASVAGATSITVLDNYPFAQNEFLIIGGLGLDKTEIQKINASVTQGTALTLVTTTYDHPVDTPIQKTLWDQVEISGANSLTGSKVVITTISLQPDRSETTYTNAGTTYTYYYSRYKNSVTGTFSAYSSPAPAAGYSTNTVRAVKQEALDMTNEKIDGKLITDQWMNNEVLNCEQEVWSERKQWSWAYTFDYILGQPVTGQLGLTLPTDISDANSNKSILEGGVHLGTLDEMKYITKEEWDQFFVQTSHTTLAQSVGISDTTIYLTSVSDFATSGSIVIGSDSAIAYTGVNTTANTLTGVTGTTATHASGDDVWQNGTFAEPVYFTVFGGKLYFQAGLASTYTGLNCYISYYRKPTAISSDNDTLNIPDFSLYHYFLSWKILLRKNNGKSSDESEKFRMLYEERKSLLKKQERTGQRVFMRPRANRIQFPRTDARTSFNQVDV